MKRLRVERQEKRVERGTGSGVQCSVLRSTARLRSNAASRDALVEMNWSQRAKCGFGSFLHTHPSILNFRPSTCNPQRSGSVLLIVLVIISVLTLAAYNYTQSTLTEYEATTMYGADVQARETADSGIEYIATIVSNRTDPALQNLQHNPNLFMGRTVVASPRARGNARFSIIAPVENSTTSNAIRYGLMDESAKLNLNMIQNMQLDDDDMHTLLMNLPGMTLEIADALLDWIDPDDTARTYGAESETYGGFNPPYAAKNGPIDSLDELLMVRGVTPALLYGEDANRNGLLDPNENDGDASPPTDNADGILDHGWVSYFTAYSRESNLRADGREKIHVNNGLLTELYDALIEEFDKPTAQFVIAVRINGPINPPSSSSSGSGGSSASGSSGSKSGSGGSSSGSGGSSSSGGSSKSSSGSSSSGTSKQTQQAVQSLTSTVASAVLATGGTVTRDGIDLSAGGPYTIPSLWMLFGTQATVTINGAKQTLSSPWPADTTQLPTLLPRLIETLTTSNDEFLEGRINVNQARKEILMGIPGMTDDLVNSIIDAQKLDANGQPSLDVIQQHNTTGWLFFEGLVDLPTMQSLDPYFTARGDVYRAQVFGFFDGGGPVSRVEAVIDGTKKPPRILFQRDLNDLGHGYSRLQLMPVPR
jgi:uncharacterized membrane protein YgcG